MGIDNSTHNEKLENDEVSQYKKEKEEIFDIIENKKDNLNELELFYIFEKLFRYDISYGIHIINKLGISKSIILDIIKTKNFFLRHPYQIEKLRHLIQINYKKIKHKDKAQKFLEDTANLPQFKKKYYLKQDEKKNPRLDVNEDFYLEKESIVFSQKSKEIIDKIENFYHKYIEKPNYKGKNRIAKSISTDDRSIGTKIGEDELFPIIRRIVNDDKYSVLDLTLQARVKDAEKENLQELNQLLETYFGEHWQENIMLEKNYITGLYEIKSSKDNIEKREEKQISNPYHMIRLIGILNGDIYCESRNWGPEETQYKIMKNGKEILENYENISSIGFADGNIYYTAKNNGKIILLENGIRILDQYNNIKYNEIIDGKLYCIVEKDGKYVLLENNKEISDEYDEIKSCDLELQQYNYSDEDRKKYSNIGERCVGRKNGKWILLNHGKEASDEYDKITYYAQRDGKVYYLANKGRKKVLLKEGEEISEEYDEIILSFGDNGDAPYSARIDNQRFLVGNEEKTPTQYDNNFYRGYEFLYRMLNRDKYCLVIRPGEIFVVKNGEIVSNIYENYEYRWRDRVNGKLYWCFDKDFHYVLLENGKEILSGYRNIGHCESAGGHIYCVAQNEDRKYILFKDWNEILEEYDNIRFCEIVDGNIYHLAKKDDKTVLLEDGEILTQEYDDIDYGKWADGKLYSIAKLGGKQILLESGREISGSYDGISFLRSLEGKIYHNATQNDMGILLENGKQILRGYEVHRPQKINGRIYCTAKKGSNDVLLENRKEVSKEYDDIYFHAMIDGNLYYTAENNMYSVLIENKIIDSNELKLPNEIKDKLEFLNLCMMCGNLENNNIKETYTKIKKYLSDHYNEEKQNEYSILGLTSFYTDRLGFIFRGIINDNRYKTNDAIIPVSKRTYDEDYAEILFEYVFNDEKINENEKSQDNIQIEIMKGPCGGGSGAGNSEKPKGRDGEKETIKRILSEGNNVENKELGTISSTTKNIVNQLINVYKYSGYKFGDTIDEDGKIFLNGEITKLISEHPEFEEINGKNIINFLTETERNNRIKDLLNLIKGLTTQEDYNEIDSLIEKSI